MKLRKINQLASNQPYIKSSIKSFDRLKKPLEYFLNPDVGNKNLNELNQHYISDGETEETLQDILSDPMDSISILVGYQGIGKSTDIRHSYQIMNEAIKLDAEHRAIIFPSFFKGYVLGTVRNDDSMFITDMRLELAKKIAAICMAIEEEVPEIINEFNSEEGKNKFLDFLKLTNPKSLVDITTLQDISTEQKINNAYLNDYFIYIVTKLKYYLLSPKCIYNRILVILDDIEALPNNLYQEQMISQYMRLYTCLRNLPDLEIKKNIYVNMLISFRPMTYKLIQNSKVIPLNSFARKIYKTKGVDLKTYFNKKYVRLPEEYKRQSEWKDAYNILAYLSDKFDNKYANMIKRLVFMDIREALKTYYRILENFTWTAKDTEKNDDNGNTKIEYIFNNITVIRALACDNNIVYYNDKDNLIPNVFYDTTDKDNILLSLFIILYFVQKQHGVWEYGESTFSISKIIMDFRDAFGEKNIDESKLLENIKYLYESGILTISIFDKAEVLSEESLICLSSKGLEIWSMLSSDSVLMELYREDFYQKYDENEKGYRFYSSKELMDCNMQVHIFDMIYKILLALYDVERAKVQIAINNGSYGKYLSLFGGESIVEHLMKGVDKSIEYSGNSENNMIKEDSIILKKLIDEMKELL